MPFMGVVGGPLSGETCDAPHIHGAKVELVKLTVLAALNDPQGGVRQEDRHVYRVQQFIDDRGREVFVAAPEDWHGGDVIQEMLNFYINTKQAQQPRLVIQ